MNSMLHDESAARIEDSGNVVETAHSFSTGDNGRLVSTAFRFTIDAEAPIAHPAVPELGVSLVASTHGPLSVVQSDGSCVTGTLLAFGPSLTPRLVLAGTRMRGTHLTLTPLGARDLLGIRMGDIADTVVNVCDLPTPVSLDEKNPLRHSSPRASSTEMPDLALRWWSLLSSSTSSLDDLAALTGVSPRRVRDLIASEFGLTPKGWQRLARHQRARRLILNGYPLARVATEAGYADQSHLQREWRSFAMQTPTQSTRSEYFSPPVPNWRAP